MISKRWLHEWLFPGFPVCGLTASWHFHIVSDFKGGFILQTNGGTQDFVHPKLGQEVTAIGGHYVFGKEIRLPYKVREILYFVGYAVLDSTCCGVGGTAYVLVPGYIWQWKYKKDHNHCPVSRVMPIDARIDQKQIRNLIQKKEMVYQVTFN